MENYNPRQNTRMRWKDERELEKFKFISGDFNFASEVLENASKDPTYSKIINLLKSISKDDSTPVLINDLISKKLFIGTCTEKNGIKTYWVGSNELELLHIFYTESNDMLVIEDISEEVLSADNVKTLFGNQSLIGTGNIDLYRHQLTLTFLKPETESNTRIQFEVYSSNKLVVDSLQDLTNLLKPNNNSSFIGFSLDESNQLYLIVYEDSIWKVGEIIPPPYIYKPVLSVKDVVTTI